MKKSSWPVYMKASPAPTRKNCGIRKNTLIGSVVVVVSLVLATDNRFISASAAAAIPNDDRTRPMAILWKNFRCHMLTWFPFHFFQTGMMRRSYTARVINIATTKRRPKYDGCDPYWQKSHHHLDLFHPCHRAKFPCGAETTTFLSKSPSATMASLSKKLVPDKTIKMATSMETQQIRNSSFDRLRLEDGDRLVLAEERFGKKASEQAQEERCAHEICHTTLADVELGKYITPTKLSQDGSETKSRGTRRLHGVQSLLKSPKKEEQQVPDATSLNSTAPKEASTWRDRYHRRIGWSFGTWNGDDKDRWHHLSWDLMDWETGFHHADEEDEGDHKVYSPTKYLKEEREYDNQDVLDAWSDRGPLLADDCSISTPTSVNGYYMGEVPMMELEERTRREASVLRYKEKRQTRLSARR
ncbi:hypothetical protein F3Y22_tig00110956pilonHSYRG00228 [Hibiscus syriacus]|uniref:Uncharacterized protein n=1 Tax=Hibiscus syriacus TaxID=106335 RepID=A0A6A2ZBJ4_HIBSY|nr:hypothetical protein F3Y22_tig00110956pilonHSYRG00228 [Hibiscus syriacus]